MRSPPTQPYSGLTVVVDKFYRNDWEPNGEGFDPERKLLGGSVGRWFDNELLASGFNVHRGSIEIRMAGESAPLLAGTKCVLYLGEGSPLPSGVSLGEQRGSPTTRDIPEIFSYAPQDAYDRRAYFEDEDDDDTESVQDTKSHGKTRRKNYRFWLRRDIHKAVRLSQEGLIVPQTNYNISPGVDATIKALNSAGDDLYFDIETEENLQMTCFGFGHDASEVFVVPMLETHHGDTYAYSMRDTSRILHTLGKQFYRKLVIGHHINFDLFVMCWRHGLPIPRRVFCTMNSWSRCYIEVERSLGHVLSATTDLPYHKNEGVFRPWNANQAEDLYRYNGKDVFALTQIKPAIEKEAEKLGASENVSLVNRSFIPYFESTLRGARVDWAAVKTIVDYNTRVMARQQKIISTLCGFPLNPNSSQGQWSVKSYLYGKEGLGIKLPAKDPTNEKTLYQVLLKHDVPVVPWIIQFRQKGKQGRVKEDGEIGGKLGFNGWEGSTVISKFSSPRFTTQWKFSPVTFRRASAKLRVFDSHWGDNFQNFEKYLRKIILADEGYSLIQVDESGADARCVAWLCRHGEYRELFLNKIKPHQFVALHIFGDKFQAKCARHPGLFKQLSLLRAKELRAHPKWKAVARFISKSDNWPAKERYYFIAKKICHASSYGMGPRTFRLSVLQETEGKVNLSNDEARHFLDFFFKLFPEIKSWQDETFKQVDRYGVLRNLFGHPRVFSSHYPGDDSQAKEMYAFNPQSTVGQIIAYAVAELHERKSGGDELLNEADYTFLQDGHDALMFQCKTALEDDVRKAAQSHINRILRNSRGEEFEMLSEFQVGPRWSFK